MSKTENGCCTASLWTSIIAGLQMAGSLLSLILCTWMMFRMDKFTASLKGTSVWKENTQEMLEIFGIIAIVQSLVCFVFSVILLVGIINKTIGMLYIWLGSNAIMIIVDIVQVILEVEYTQIVKAQTVTTCVLNNLLRIFGIWVTLKAKNKIWEDMTQRSVAPVEMIKSVKHQITTVTKLSESEK